MLYHIVTYGCQMNLHESEKAAGMLEARGYLLTTEIEEADLILFNTCCIREGAENRAIGNIGALKPIKSRKPNLIIAVMGCMTQQDGKALKLASKFPFVDIWIGTHNVCRLGEKIDALLESKRHIIDVIDNDLDEMDSVKAVRSSGLNAWVNISYGCNNFCTYCIVPYVRGREHSRSVSDIKIEVQKSIEDGYKEITLLGQNVNSFGNDIKDETVTFAALLKELASISGEFRIKYMTSHPKDFNADVATAIRDNKNISKLLHLPAQSGSTAVLAAMNRKYTREDYLEKISLVRSIVPSIGLSTDIMVGFPGETDYDFQETLDLAEKVRFDNMYMFVYSRRKGTAADEMPIQIPQEVKDKRIHALVDTNRRISAELARECVGMQCRSLAEIKGGVLTATTDSGKFVTLESKNETLHGQFVQIEITQSKAGKLYGKTLE